MRRVGYMIDSYDYEFCDLNRNGYAGRYVAIFQVHLSCARGMAADLGLPPMMFYLSSYLIKYRLGEHWMWTLWLTEYCALCAVAFIKQAYERFRLFWMPEFVERELAAWSLVALTKVLGSRANADDFRRLFAIRNRIWYRVTDPHKGEIGYSATWANVPNELRHDGRPEWDLSLNPGSRGPSENSLAFVQSLGTW